jgi:cytochrome c553
MVLDTHSKETQMKRITFALAWLAFITSAMLSAGQQTAAPSSEVPKYVKGSSLVRPADYREWVFLSAGLGMNYGPSASAGQSQRFDNVFVNPSAYRAFMKTGTWPDKTTFVLEVRASASEGSINTGGRFQAGVVGLEAEVKDSKFPDGWAFFNFTAGGKAVPADSAEPLPVDAGCVECHTKNTAVERTFVQFYPTLMEVARKMNTVKPGF